MRALVLPALCILLLACGRESPETKIRKAFDGAVRAVEAGDAGGAAGCLSPKFAGPDGMDRQAAQLYLAAVVRREKVGVTVLTQKVEVDGARAVQTVDLLLTGRSGGGLLPEDRSRRTLVLRWELRDGDWRIRELVQD